MERMRQAKLVKLDAPTASAVDVVSPEPTTAAVHDELSEVASSSREGVTTESEQAESLDESLRVPVSAQLSDHDSSESSDDGSSFTNDDAREVYQAWLKEKSKHDIKVMAVMFMDNLIERFDMTTLGAVKEVCLLLGHNEKTICTWRRDFYNNGGHFTESLQEKHSRQFVLDDEELRHKAAQWVREMPL